MHLPCERLGHAATLRTLRQMQLGGENIVPDISPDQFECAQFFCPTCAVTRSMIGEMAEERVAPRAVGGLPHTRTLAAAARLHIAQPRR